MAGSKRRRNARKKGKLWRGQACETCGAREDLQCHHKDGDTMNNDKENIATLCRRCHQRVHGTEPKGPFRGPSTFPTLAHALRTAGLWRPE